MVSATRPTTIFSFLTVLSSIVAQTVRRVQIVNREKENLRTENLKLKRELSEKNRINDIIGNSSRMQDVFDMVHRVADSNATVLLRGESGTGKTLVAKALHYNGREKGQTVCGGQLFCPAGNPAGKRAVRP